MNDLSFPYYNPERAKAFKDLDKIRRNISHNHYMKLYRKILKKYPI